MTNDLIGNRDKWNSYMREYRKTFTDAQKKRNLEWQKIYREKTRELIHSRNKVRYDYDPSIQTDRGIKSANKIPGRTLLRGAKANSKKRGLEFSIDISDIIIPEICPLLGYPLQLLRGVGPRPEAPSVDRIDSTKGYVKGNIQIISKKANLMKNNATKDELVYFANKVLEFYDE